MRGDTELVMGNLYLVNIVRIRATMIIPITAHTAFRSLRQKKLNRSWLFQTNKPADHVQTRKQD
jgi:hypothetical protein